ncbi:hypothetical protein ACOSQ2_006418 [Xanthoceras sorbifolium]
MTEYVTREEFNKTLEEKFAKHNLELDTKFDMILKKLEEFKPTNTHPPIRETQNTDSSATHTEQKTPLTLTNLKLNRTKLFPMNQQYNSPQSNPPLLPTPPNQTFTPPPNQTFIPQPRPNNYRPPFNNNHPNTRNFQQFTQPSLKPQGPYDKPRGDKCLKFLMPNHGSSECRRVNGNIDSNDHDYELDAQEDEIDEQEVAHDIYEAYGDHMLGVIRPLFLT